MNFLQNKLFTDKIQVVKEIFKVENTTFIRHFYNDDIFIIQSDIRQQDNLAQKPALKRIT